MADLLVHGLVVDEAVVEHSSDDDKEGEEKELREEAGDDEFLARVESCQGAAGLDTASWGKC
jgi:hypothetical protein